MKTIWVQASAGCGKTSLIIDHYQMQKKNSLFISFSNATIHEFQNRLNYKDNIKCNTIHSLAYEFLRLRSSNLRIQEKKLTNEALGELLINNDFKLLYQWLLDNDDLKLDYNLDELDNFILEKELPLIDDQKYQILFDNQIIFKENLEFFIRLFFNKDGSEKKRLKIDINRALDVNVNNLYINQLKKRVKFHQNLYQKYVFNIKKNVRNALKMKENELKLKENIVYYDDLLQQCLDLIQTDSGIVFELLGNIKTFYIDETQDLSKEQFDLIFAIIQEWSVVEGELLVVGDSKQLIYEFQGASLQNYNEFKNRIKNYSKSFEELSLNKTYRLPKIVCDLLNNIGNTLDIGYSTHSTINENEGSVSVVKINNIVNILDFITNNTMILFKQKNDEMKTLALVLMQNGYFLNSPYIVEHPIIKDFQYLLKWLIYKDKLSLGIVMNVFGINNKNFDALLQEESIMSFLNSLNYKNLNILFLDWINNPNVNAFLSKKLGPTKDVYFELLRQYCSFYKYSSYEAIYDINSFYKNTDYIDQGLFLNTIHSSKGKEADTVIILNCDLDSKFKHDTNRLLYVALTRVRKNLVIPFYKVSGKWLELINQFS